jgi:hypothetical protein
MKTQLVLLALSVLFVTSARAEEATMSNIKIEDQSHTESSVTSSDQFVSLAFAPFAPASVQISNGAYNFNYGQKTSTYMGQAGWGIKLFDLGGAFYFEENLGFSQLSGNTINEAGAQAANSSYSVDFFGFDTRLMYEASWFPWKRLVPFVDGGYLYTIYYQPGNSGLDSVSGGVGNPVAGGGLRFWLNRQSAMNGAHPVFLTGKVNRIFTSSNSVNSVDLTSTSVFGGVSFGL